MYIKQFAGSFYSARKSHSFLSLGLHCKENDPSKSGNALRLCRDAVGRVLLRRIPRGTPDFNSVRALLSSLALLVSVLSFTFLPLHASDTYDDSALDFFDQETLAAMSLASTAATCDPATIADFLIQGLDAVCLLQQNFYLRTNELNQRSLLDYGLFIPFTYPRKKNDLTFHFFYQQTTRDNFTRNSTNIDTYLAIFRPTLIDALESVLNNVRDLVELPYDVRSILPLFKNMTVQERRLGLMLHGIRTGKRIRFRYLVPVYYSEANLFLTPQEQEAIEEQLGINDPAEDLKFARQHLIADKLGIGDFRLNIDIPLRNIGSITSRAGVLATIPTAFAFKKGLYGSSFKKSTQRPCLDLCNIFTLATTGNFDQLALLGQQLALSAIDQFSANLIEVPLGNGGHFGIGAYMRSKTYLSTLIKRPWAQHIKMTSWTSVEYLFPRQQLRNFIPASNTAAFAAAGLLRPMDEILDQLDNDPAYAQSTLTFLEQEIINRIFPFTISTRVQPGVIFRWVSRYSYKAPRWGYSVGSDLWLTTKEKLSRLKIPIGVPQNLNKVIAQKPFGYQVGTMATIYWKQKNNFMLSLNAEYNFTSIGIGADFLFTFALEKLF